MTEAVIDTDVLFAPDQSSDARADTANEIIGKFARGDLPPASIITNVLQEALKHFQNQNGWETAVSRLQFYAESSGFTLDHPLPADIELGRKLFQSYDSLEFTDAVILAYMREREVQYLYSFTSRFDDFDDITRLNAAVDPFP
jgi:predicted nucleic acid-binding protein